MTRPWCVGDRLWTPFDGTCTVRQLRQSGPPANAHEALIEPHWLPGERHWRVIDADTVRLDPGEPDRPSEGLQTVHEGQSVMHLKFGVGVVVKHAFEPAVGLTVACIRFDGEESERSIALGNGSLRAAV